MTNITLAAQELITLIQENIYHIESTNGRKYRLDVTPQFKELQNAIEELNNDR